MLIAVYENTLLYGQVTLNKITFGWNYNFVLLNN